MAEHLTTGWEPLADLPVGDTVVRRFLHNLAEYVASASQAMGGTTTRADDLVVSNPGRPADLMSSAVLLAPVDGPHGWDDLLHRVEVASKRERPAATYLWSAWPTPDLAEAGWELVGHPPMLVRQPGGVVPEAQPLDVRRVTDAAGVDDWCRVAVEGYPMPELLPYREGALYDERVLDDPRWRLWVGYDRGRPVSISALFVAHGFAHLALGVTRRTHRGGGFWHAMLRERLLAEPDLLSGSVFSDDSRHGIERLGYLPVTRFTLWRRTYGDASKK
jgi:hypothetical protein